MTLPAIPLWAATSADLATLSDHGVVMLAAMLSAELRDWRHMSTAALLAAHAGARRTMDDGSVETVVRATVRSQVYARLLTHRVLYRRAIDEASRRGLVPSDADLRVAIDAALAAGRIDPEHLPVTLAEVWAACTMVGAERYFAMGDVEAWASAIRLPGAHVDYATVELRAAANMTPAEMREWYGTFDVDAPPIGRGLARRLGRGRRRGR